MAIQIALASELTFSSIGGQSAELVCHGIWVQDSAISIHSCHYIKSAEPRFFYGFRVIFP